MRRAREGAARAASIRMTMPRCLKRHGPGRGECGLKYCALNEKGLEGDHARTFAPLHDIFGQVFFL
jgi:hypothetical protein